jgi:hypothetical protein
MTSERGRVRTVRRLEADGDGVDADELEHRERERPSRSGR